MLFYEMTLPVIDDQQTGLVRYIPQWIWIRPTIPAEMPTHQEPTPYIQASGGALQPGGDEVAKVGWPKGMQKKHNRRYLNNLKMILIWKHNICFLLYLAECAPFLRLHVCLASGIGNQNVTCHLKAWTLRCRAPEEGNLSLRFLESITMLHHRSVDWNDIPSLPGWKHVVVMALRILLPLFLFCFSSFCSVSSACLILRVAFSICSLRMMMKMIRERRLNSV